MAVGERGAGVEGSCTAGCEGSKTGDEGMVGDEGGTAGVDGGTIGIDDGGVKRSMVGQVVAAAEQRRSMVGQRLEAAAAFKLAQCLSRHARAVHVAERESMPFTRGQPLSP